MSEGQIERLLAADWASLKPALLLCAEREVARRKWRSTKSLPKGLEPVDLVYDAIEKALSGIRNWNFDEYLDAYSFLKSVIESDANALVRSEEHLKTNYSAGATEDEAQRKFLSDVDSSGYTQERSDPESILIRSQDIDLDVLYPDLMKGLYAAFKDDENVTLVLMSYESQAASGDVPKHIAVSKDSGLNIHEVRNAIRRIKREAVKVLDGIKAERNK